MPDSKSEQVLKALLAALVSQAPAGALVGRNEIAPEYLPDAGALILRDGNPGTPQQELSPPVYAYEHRAQIDAVVGAPDAATRDARFDVLKQSVAAAVAADRSLGGTCEWAQTEAPQPEDIPVENGAPLKAAIIQVVLYYETADPLT